MLWMTTHAGTCIQQGKVLLHSVAFLKSIERRDSVTYGVAKELAGMLKPFIGKSPHHIQDTQNFIESIQEIILQTGECITAYDVSALFTLIFS